MLGVAMRISGLVPSLAFRLALLSGLGLLLLAVIASLTLGRLLLEQKHELTRSEVETAISIISNYDKRSKRGEFSQDVAQERAKTTLRAMRFSGNEYFFVMNEGATLLVHGVRPEIEGSDFSQVVDPTGYNYPQAMVAAAKAGGGHTHYYFPRPGADEPVRKIAYTAQFEPWRWIIGAGLYEEDIEAIIFGAVKAFSIIAIGVFIGVCVLAFFAFLQMVSAIDGRRKAEQEAMQVSKLAGIGQLAAGLAHEINTPAQYIGDNLRYLCEEQAALVERMKQAQLLSEEAAANLGTELAEAVRDGLDGVARIANIVGSMKAFSQTGSKEIVLADINRALVDVLTVAESIWKPVAIVEKRFAADLPMLSCQIAEINQVFLNLLVNAVEAIRQYDRSLPGVILIETLMENDQIVVRFTDNGPGVPTDIRERIFDPFFTTKAVGEGVGLGLAVCRDIVEVKHGGRIDVSSVNGSGAVFTIRLPVRNNFEKAINCL
jgi:signal transduction histidine kinase